jgi:hypothetical protein
LRISCDDDTCMKPRLSFLLLILLVSCTTPPAPETSVASNTPPVLPTHTRHAPTSIPSVTASPSPTVTPTAEPLCDPLLEEYCIREGSFPLQRPVRLPANDRIDAVYGYGSTANGTRDPHHGVEFANASGTPVYAAAEGRVIFAGPDEQAVYAPWANFYGNLVVIEHPDQVFTLYAHLSRIDVEGGQSVAAGQKIGEVGSSGGAIGSHLHFEVRRGNAEDYFATENPVLWLVPANDENGQPFGTMMISVVDAMGQLVTEANFSIAYFPDDSGTPSRLYYGTTYVPDLQTGRENAAFSDLPAGRYRIVVETNGQMLERRVEVESGNLTEVVFVAR